MHFKKILLSILLTVFIFPNLIVTSNAWPIRDLTSDVIISNYCLYIGNVEDESKAVILNGVKTGKTLTQYNSILITFELEIKDEDMWQVYPGAYFELDILDPQYLQLNDSEKTGVVKNPNNDLILGDYVINDQGVLTFTYNNNGYDERLNHAKFTYNSKVMNPNPSYPVRVEKDKTVNIELKARDYPNEPIMGTKAMGQQRKLVKSGYVDGDNIIWSVIANMDQLEKLNAGSAVDTRENLIIEDKISKNLVLDKTYFRFFSRIYVPYVDKNNNYQMPSTPVLSNKYLGQKLYNKNKLNSVVPNAGESYEDFKNRLKNMNIDQPTYAFYDNPDSEHSAAVLFVWGDSAGTNTPKGNNFFTYEDFFSEGLNAYVDAKESESKLTHEQAEHIKNVYGPSGTTGGKVVSFTMNYKTMAPTTSIYENTANMYWGQNSSDEATVLQEFTKSGLVISLAPIDISVKKVWEDNKNDEVEIVLYKDGVATDKSVKLNSGNNFQGSFNNLYRYFNGSEIIYTVKEKSVEGYDAFITGDVDSGFVITNKKINNGGDIAIEEEKTDENTSEVISENTSEEETTSVSTSEEITSESANVQDSTKSAEIKTSNKNNNSLSGGDIIAESFDINSVPDANDESAPEFIIVIGDDGTPLGRYTKKLVDGEFEWIDDDGLALGKVDVVQTGADLRMLISIVIAAYSLSILLLIKRTGIYDE